MTVLTDAAIENEIAAGLMPRATINVAYRQMLATERVAAALEKLLPLMHIVSGVTPLENLAASGALSLLQAQAGIP